MDLTIEYNNDDIDEPDEGFVVLANNEGLIKNSVPVTLVGTPSKLPAYHHMCATMSWLPCTDYHNKNTLWGAPG